MATVTKIGKVYGRLFEPTLSANEYATMQFLHYYKCNDSDCFSMISSLLGNMPNNKEHIVDALQSLLEEYGED